MADVGRRRKMGQQVPRHNGNVVSGSVWESRIKMDEVKGGFKVFNGESSSSSEDDDVIKEEEGGNYDLGGVNVLPLKEKRKTWRVEPIEVIAGIPIQRSRFNGEIGRCLGRGFSENESDDDCGSDWSVAEEKKAIPITRNDRKAIPIIRNEQKATPVARNGQEPIPSARKDPKVIPVDRNDQKTMPVARRDQKAIPSVQYEPKAITSDRNGVEAIPIAEIIQKAVSIVEKSLKATPIIENGEKPIRMSPVSSNSRRRSPDGQEDVFRTPTTAEKSPKLISPVSISLISSSLKKRSPDGQEEIFRTPPVMRMEGGMIERNQMEIKKRYVADKDIVYEDCSEYGDDDDEMEEEREKKSCYTSDGDDDISVKREKGYNIKKNLEKPPVAPVFKNLAKPPPFVPRHPVFDLNVVKPAEILGHDDVERPPQVHAKLQNIVDLVLWRDIFRSALVFGFGAITLFSSASTKDLNFSLVSAIAYMSFFYLVAIFFYKSILCRGTLDLDDSNKLQQQPLVVEEEAICLLKLGLPYLNEFHLKLKSLFSGDPVATLKASILLFVLSQCGSSITIWNMVRLGFIGVFTVPKLCSSHSIQLSQWVETWVRLLQDSWDAFSYKKTLAATIFAHVWIFSSRITFMWAVFVLVVIGVQNHRQSFLSGEWRKG